MQKDLFLSYMPLEMEQLLEAVGKTCFPESKQMKNGLSSFFMEVKIIG